jgi:hypothetical protein
LLARDVAHDGPDILHVRRALGAEDACGDFADGAIGDRAGAAL